MHIFPENKTIREMLKSQKQFTIPRFQREFVWDAKQCETLLLDLITSMIIKDNKIEISQYFLGTMLFIENPHKRQYEVVDGQQRLTAITILFSVIAQLFKDVGQEGLASLVFEYIMTKDDDGNPVRIIRTETSHPYFANYVQMLDNRIEEKPGSSEEEKLKNAYDYFYSILKEDNIRGLFAKYIDTNINEVSYLDIIKAIRDEMLECLIISITAQERQDAYKLFEILNGKGKSLNDADLIKNRLFEVLNRVEPSDFASDKWREMKDNLSYKDGFIETSVFLRHYWLSSRSTVTKTNLFQSFCRISHNEYNDFLLDLVKNSKYYNLTLEPDLKYFENKRDFKTIIQSLAWLNEFSVIQPKICIMVLLDIYERKLIVQKNLTKALIFLQDFHFVYTAIMKERPNRLDSIYSKFAIKLRKCNSKDEVNNTIDDFLYKELIELFPTLENFKLEFIKLTYAKNNSRDNMKAKFAINRLNSYYSKSDVFEPDGSIEHIVPETSNSNATNIGNLILLERRLNDEAANYDYDEKIGIYKKSNYEWVGEFIKNNESFSVDEIESRNEKLAEIYYQNFVDKYKRNVISHII